MMHNMRKRITIVDLEVGLAALLPRLKNDTGSGGLRATLITPHEAFSHPRVLVENLPKVGCVITNNQRLAINYYQGMNTLCRREMPSWIENFPFDSETAEAHESIRLGNRQVYFVYLDVGAEALQPSIAFIGRLVERVPQSEVIIVTCQCLGPDLHSMVLWRWQEEPGINVVINRHDQEARKNSMCVGSDAFQHIADFLMASWPSP